MSTTDSLRRSVLRYVDARVESWRNGSSEGQTRVLLVLTLFTALLLLGSVTCYRVFPAGCFLLPIVAGGLMLRWRPLAVLTVIAVLCAVTSSLLEAGDSGFPEGRIGTLVVIVCVALIQLYMVRLNRSELPTPLGQAMLAELRDRLQAQGRIPELPAGWRAEQLIRPAGGTSYAGDFMVAELDADKRQLEVILVDLWGKGIPAGPKSLQFAGALGGLIGSLPPLGLVSAANDYLLRQRWDDGLATAVYVGIDLSTGRYLVINAGHPPALRWCARTDTWYTDPAEGMALGVAERPEFRASEGMLEPGEALMLYTDGVVESRDRDVADGIAWLQKTAAEAIRLGFDGASRRIIDKVPRRDDDSAIVLLERLVYDE